MKHRLRSVELDSICNIEYGTRVTRKKDAGTKYPVYGGGGKTFNIDKFNRENVFIVSRFGMSEHCTRFVPGKFFLNDSGLSLTAKKEYKLLNEFLGYQLLLRSKDIYNLGRGTAQKNLDVKNFKKMKFKITDSLDEQKRIVKKLDTLMEQIDKAIQNVEQNIKNAEELFQSYLNEIFSQRGDGWNKMSLGEIGKVSMCKRILKKQTSPTGDIPFYKIGTFGKKPNAFISNDIFKEYKQKYSFPNKGEILISASGTIGRRVVYDGEPAYFQDSNIVWIQNNEELILNSYLYNFYGICDWNPSKGATISRLYNDDLRKIQISFPSIVKQKKLVKAMNGLESQTQTLKLNYKKELGVLNELKQSILEKAFNGEL